MGLSWSSRLTPFCEGAGFSTNESYVPNRGCGVYCVPGEPTGQPDLSGTMGFPNCTVPQPNNPYISFTLFQMPLEQSLYDPALWWFLLGLVLLTLTVDSIQRVSLRIAAGDRCMTSFVNRMVAELMLFGMAAVTIMTMYEATARQLSSVVVDQLHWIDVYVSVSAILLIFVGVWVWFFVVRSKDYYHVLMADTTDVTRQGLDLEVAGGYITRMLAGEFGLETTYSFGLYVREISAQGVVDLIDVNLLGWVGFMSPGVIGLIASYSLQSIEYHTARDSLLFTILVGWFWMILTILLHCAVMFGQKELRHFYGMSDVNKVKELKGRMLAQQGGLSGISVRGTDSGVGQGTEMLPPGAARGGLTAASLKAPMSQRNRDWIDRAQGLTQSLSGDPAITPSVRDNQVSPTVPEAASTISGAASGKGELLARNYYSAEHGLAADLARTPMTMIWAARNLWWMKQLLQVIMLNMCGQLAVYMLTLFHWIDAIGLGGAWHLFALFPPFFTLFILLPWTMQIYALFEAYAVPRAEILDNVISDEDELGIHIDYVRKQLGGRRRAAQQEGPSGEQHFFEKLEQYQAVFEQTSTPTSRFLDATLDLARGEPKSYLAPEACFFLGMLTACGVPISKERMEHIVPLLATEMKNERPTVARVFDVLGLDPPPSRGSRA